MPPLAGDPLRAAGTLNPTGTPWSRGVLESSPTATRPRVVAYAPEREKRFFCDLVTEGKRVKVDNRKPFVMPSNMNGAIDMESRKNTGTRAVHLWPGGGVHGSQCKEENHINCR
jgi:hypothetical protein